jgi:hypothetical protein
MANRIPLDAAERAFFSDASVTGVRYSPSALVLDGSAPGQVDVNDFTVIRLGDRPLPRSPKPRPYAKMHRGPIKANIPSTFWSLKLPARREAEPPQPITYCVTPTRLFEEDLAIIARKRAALDALRPSAPRDAPADDTMVPKIFQRELEQCRLRQREERERKEAEVHSAHRKAIREREQWDADRLRLKQDQQQRESMWEEQLNAEPQRASENLNRPQKRHLKFDRAPTHASKLRHNSCRRELERTDVGQSRERWNTESRREKARQITRKIRDVLIRINPVRRGNGTAEQNKRQIRTDQKTSTKLLLAMDTKLEEGPTLLERTCENEPVDDKKEVEDASVL